MAAMVTGFRDGTAPHEFEATMSWTLINSESRVVACRIPVSSEAVKKPWRAGRSGVRLERGNRNVLEYMMISSAAQSPIWRTQ